MDECGCVFDDGADGVDGIRRVVRNAEERARTNHQVFPPRKPQSQRGDSAVVIVAEESSGPRELRFPGFFAFMGSTNEGSIHYLRATHERSGGGNESERLTSLSGLRLRWKLKVTGTECREKLETADGCQRRNSLRCGDGRYG